MGSRNETIGYRMAARNHELAKHTSNYLWEYQAIRNGNQESMQLQSEYYLSKIEDFAKKHQKQFKSIQYDAIYVDEGQDFLENWFKILFMMTTAPGERVMSEAVDIAGRVATRTS